MASQTQLEKGDTTKIDYDNVILRIGRFGRYQRRIFFILCLPALSCALHKMGGVFLAAKPDFRCLLPNENPENATYEIANNIFNSSQPWDNKTDTWGQCKRYDPDLTDANHSQGENVLSMTPATKCDSFVYDKTQYTSTATTEWNLVCDSAWLKTLSESLFMLADLPGCVIFGGLSDRYGRRTVLLWGSLMQSVFAILVAISPDLKAFIVFRILVGTTINGLLVIGYVSVVEMASPQNRMTVATYFNLAFATGYILSSGLAYFIRKWRSLQIALAIPTLVLLAFWRHVPESARWLLTKGRLQEAKDTLEKLSLANGIKLSSNTLNALMSNDSGSCPDVVKVSAFDILRHPGLRKKTLLLFVIWFVNSVTYYGLAFNTSNLGGNEYLNSLIAAAVEVPAYIFLLFVLDVWGRKIVLCGSMLLAGVVLLVTYFVPIGMPWLVKVLAMAGKLAITVSWGTAYVFTAEHYPTTIRNVGIGVCSAVARLGGAVAPNLNYLFQISTSLPLAMLGSATVIAGLLSLLLPETLNEKLPESIEDSEQFGKSTSKAKKAFEQLNGADVKKLLLEEEDKACQKQNGLI